MINLGEALTQKEAQKQLKEQLVEIERQAAEPARDPAEDPVENFLDDTTPSAQEQQLGRKKFSLVRLNEIETKPPYWRIEGILESDALALLFSGPGDGKTFLAVDMGCCIATATPWHGHAVKQGPVVFIAGEGHNGLKKRFLAWGIRHEVNIENAPIFISTTPASFLDRQSIEEVEDAVDEIVAKYESPALVVVDTVARNFGDGDENSTADMGGFIQSSDRIRAGYGCAVLLIHHVGHADKTRARGAMALKGALDFEYRLERGEDDVIRLDCTKCKDFEPPAPMAFRLRSVELPMQDEQGSPVTSAVIDSTSYEPPPKQGKQGRGKNQTKALEVLQNLFDHHRVNLEEDGRDSESARVTADEWQLECKLRAGIERNRFKEVRRSLEEAGFVVVENGFVRLGK